MEAGADKLVFAPYIALKRISNNRKRALRGPLFRYQRSEKASALTQHQDPLFALIDPAVKAEGFELVRVRVTGANTKTLQVMAERADRTMSAQDCARLSRVLSPMLDEADPVEGRYVLEVSSPGIDRPLVRPRDFEDWRGYEAKLELNRLVEGRKRFSGVLAGVDDGKVAFDIDGEEETALFPFNWIGTAKLVLTDALISESLKAAKNTPQQEQQEETTHGDNQ